MVLGCDPGFIISIMFTSWELEVRLYEDLFGSNSGGLAIDSVLSLWSAHSSHRIKHSDLKEKEYHKVDKIKLN